MYEVNIVFFASFVILAEKKFVPFHFPRRKYERNIFYLSVRVVKAS